MSHGKITQKELSEKLSNKINEISKIRLVNDINTTNYKKDDTIDVSYLHLIQSQKYGLVQWKLQNGEKLTICCQGDSLTYGHDISSIDKITAVPPHKFDRASKTYPEALAEFLNIVYLNNITVINNGYSGDCCELGYNRYNIPTNSDLTIFMYGHNDSSAAGCIDKGNVEQYIYWYEQLIIRELIWGKAIILLKSPRTIHANDKKVEAFSNAIELLATKYGIPIIDTTPFVSSYGVEIWSDKTTANVNKIYKHFSGKGYPLIAAGIASTIISESIVNTKYISSGDTLLFREQVDGCRYIKPTGNNVLNLELDVLNYTPPEREDGRSIIGRIGLGGKIIYSFYTEEEDLVVIPTIYSYANKKCSMILDFGLDQPYVNLTTKHEPQVLAGTKIPSVIDLTSTINIAWRKSYLKEVGREPLRIIRKGWHTLIIDAEDAVFSGLEFLSYNDWCNYKKKTFVVKSINSLLTANYDGLYSDILGKVNVNLPNILNTVEITGLPSNFKIVNRSATITNEGTDCNVALYEKNGSQFVEVKNNGTLSDSRVAFIDFRLWGYYQ